MRKQMLFYAVMTCVLTFMLPAAGQDYQLKQKYTIGGEGGWDYLTYDPAGKRLFISRGTRVQVVDPAKGSIIAEIPGTTGVHGIALAQELGKGFTSNGGENTVTVFDLKTLQETSKIKLPDDAKNPDAILYDAATKQVFTFNGRSKNATVIDAVKGTVVSNIPLDGKPEFAAADGKGMVYVNIEDKNEVTSIDAKKAAVVASWPLAGCEEPSGLAMDQKDHVLFSGCGNKVMAITNADNGKQVTTVPIGQGVDANGFDPATGLAFSSNGDGTLTVVKKESGKYTVLQNATTQRRARTMALDTNNHDVYLVTAEFEDTPPPAAGQPRQRPAMKPGSFTLLVMGRK